MLKHSSIDSVKPLSAVHEAERGFYMCELALVKMPCFSKDMIS